MSKLNHQQQFRQIIHLILTLALAFMTVKANAAYIEDVLQGSVGKYPIVMTVFSARDKAPNSITGMYFYVKFRHNIYINGNIRGNALYLSSKHTAEKFILTRLGNNYTGKFISPKSKTPLPVRLTLVPKGSIKTGPDVDFSPPLTDYDRLQLTGLKFVPGKKETIDNKYVIQWYTEPLSGVSMFRLASGYSPAAMAAINHKLELDHYMESLSAFTGDNSSKMHSLFLNGKFISYSRESNLGDGPTTSGVIFDVRSGNELKMEDLLWFGSGKKPTSVDALADYRSNIFAPKIIEILEQLYPDKITPSDNNNENGCDYSNPGAWAWGTFYLTSKGLYLGVDSDQIEHRCNNPSWSIIPYSVLKKYNPQLFSN